jgi:ketosteroid isomerase-like protein
VSQENVELVLRLAPARDADLAQLYRDDEMWARFVGRAGSLFQPNVETVAPGVPGTEQTYTGLDGLRAAMLDWLAPWTTYRSEVSEAIDCGERVLLFVHDFGRRERSTQEVKINGSAVWTVRDGKVDRFDAFADRFEALKAVGLEE